jgi:hypothetical protein
MDLWYTAMGLHKTVKRKNNLKTPIKSLALSNKRTWVCFQFYSPQ